MGFSQLLSLLLFIVARPSQSPLEQRNRLNTAQLSQEVVVVANEMRLCVGSVPADEEQRKRGIIALFVPYNPESFLPREVQDRN